MATTNPMDFRVINEQSRYWVFTSYRRDPPAWNPAEFQYLAYQQEEGDGGRLHWQGCLVLPGYGQRRARVVDLLGGGVHVEKRNKASTVEDMKSYVSKERTSVPGTFREFGDIHARSGLPGAAEAKDSDYNAAIEMIKNGRKMSEIAIEYPRVLFKYEKNLKALQYHLMNAGTSKDTEKKVYVYWGAAGAGKTVEAKRFIDRHYTGDAYWLKCSKTNVWWDGYEGHKCIVIDDFEGQMSIDNMLHLLDYQAGRYVWQVKGGHIKLYHETVIITSNSHPVDWYPTEKEEKKRALLRRMTEITEFQKREDGKEDISDHVCGRDIVTDGIEDSEDEVEAIKVLDRRYSKVSEAFFEERRERKRKAREELEEHVEAMCGKRLFQEEEEL